MLNGFLLILAIASLGFQGRALAVNWIPMTNDGKAARTCIDNILFIHLGFRDEAIEAVKTASGAGARKVAEQRIARYVSSPWVLPKEVAALGWYIYPHLTSDETRLVFLAHVSGTDSFVFGHGVIDDFLAIADAGLDPMSLVPQQVKAIIAKRRARWLGKQRPQVGLTIDEIRDKTWTKQNADDLYLRLETELLPLTVDDQITAVIEVAGDEYDEQIDDWSFARLRLLTVHRVLDLRDSRLVHPVKTILRRVQNSYQEKHSAYGKQLLVEATAVLENNK